MPIIIIASWGFGLLGTIEPLRTTYPLSMDGNQSFYISCLWFPITLRINIPIFRDSLETKI
jgi:hypothetical protein